MAEQQQRRSSKYNPQDIKVRMTGRNRVSSRPTIGTQSAQIERQFNPNIQDNTASNLARLVSQVSETYSRHKDVQQPANQAVATKAAMYKGMLGLGTEGLSSEEEKRAYEIGVGEAKGKRMLTKFTEQVETAENEQEAMQLLGTAAQEAFGSMEVSGEMFNGAMEELAKAKVLAESVGIKREVQREREQAATAVQDLAYSAAASGTMSRETLTSLQNQWKGKISRDDITVAALTGMDERMDEALAEYELSPTGGQSLSKIAGLLRQVKDIKRKDANGISVMATKAGRAVKTFENQLTSKIVGKFKEEQRKAEESVGSDVKTRMALLTLNNDNVTQDRAYLEANIHNMKPEHALQYANLIRSIETREARSKNGKGGGDDSEGDKLFKDFSDLTSAYAEPMQSMDGILALTEEVKTIKDKVSPTQYRQLRGDLEEAALRIRSETKTEKASEQSMATKALAARKSIKKLLLNGLKSRLHPALLQTRSDVDIYMPAAAEAKEAPIQEAYLKMLEDTQVQIEEAQDATALDAIKMPDEPREFLSKFKAQTEQATLTDPIVIKTKQDNASKEIKGGLKINDPRTIGTVRDAIGFGR